MLKMWNHVEAAGFFSWSHDSLTKEMEWLTWIEGWSKEHLDWADYAVNWTKKFKKTPESEHENHVITRT